MTKQNIFTALRRFSSWPALLFLVVAIAMVIGVRLRLRDFPLERDEGEYAYAGQLILDGIPPYQSVYTMKLPGTHLSYALIMTVFGQTTAGIHVGLIIWQLATLAVLFFVARNFLDLQGSCIATAACGLMTLSPAYYGIAAHATHFVMLPALLGLLMLLRMEQTGKLWNAFVAGCLFGIAFLMKQSGGVFAAFGGIYLAWMVMTTSKAWRQRIMSLGLYLMGCLIPFCAVCGWLKLAGVFPQFWFWTVTYAQEYATITSFSDGWENLKLRGLPVLLAAPFLWGSAAVGLIFLMGSSHALRTRIGLGGFLIFSIIGVCPGLYFREHYFISLVPAVALLAGLAVSWSRQQLAKKSCKPWLCGLPFILAAVACAQSLYSDRAVLFSLSPREACVEIYGDNPFPESLDVARYIEQNTSKSDRIAVVGSEPQIYFYARRRSSTSQIYTYPLMEPQPFAHQMQENMIREIEQNPPEFLVFVSFPASWMAGPDSSTRLIDWMPVYAQQHMRRVGLIQLTDSGTQSVWGPEVLRTPLRSESFIVVLKRK